MTITGSTFDRMRVTPINDARTYYGAKGRDYVLYNVYGDGFNRTVSGLEVTINPGVAVIQGRQVELTEPNTIAVPANSKGYIVITIDLSKENTSTGTPGDPDYSPVNNQVSMRVVTTKTQQDLNNGGQVYDFALYSYSSNGSSATTNPDWESVYSPKLESGFKAPNGTAGLKVINMGDLVWCDATVTNTSVIKAGTKVKIGTLPRWALVSGAHEALFGTSDRRFKIRIENGSDIMIMDYTSKGVFADLPAGGWIKFQFPYLRYNSPTLPVGWTSATEF